MNPALPLLLAVPALAFVVAARRRSDTARALGWIAAATLLLFSGHLALPDGVPSATALLDRPAPWRIAEAAPTTTVNLEQNALTFQVEPRLLFLREEVRAGRPGFWNPFAFGGYPQWSAVQLAPLSPFTWLALALPLPLALHLLPFLRFLVAGLGAYLLARELGARSPGAFVAAATYAFCGRTVIFVLYSLGSAMALVPWVLLAAERLARGRRGLVLLAAASALQWSSGHPELAAFTAAAAALWFALRRGADPRAWGRLVAGGATGGLIAAAALVPFLLLLPTTTRYDDFRDVRPLALADQGAVLLRLLLPESFGDPTFGNAFGRLPYGGTMIYAGAFLLPLLVAGLAALRREPVVRALALFAGIALLVTLSVPGVHHLFVLLPVLKRGLAHYFLSFAILAAGILAGFGLERLRAVSRRQLLFTAAAVALAVGGGAFALAEAWRAHGLLRENAARGALVVAAPLLLLLLRATRERAALSWAAAAVVAAELVLSTRGELPLSRRADLFPARPVLDALAGRDDGRLAAPRWVLPANTATPYRIADLRGRDAVSPAARAAALGRWDLGADDAAPLSPEERESFDRWSVRYFMTAPGGLPPDDGARLLHDGVDARLYERPGALPIVRLEQPDGGAPVQAAGDQVRIVERRPGRWTIDWTASAPRVVSIADSWDRGWRAVESGRELAVDGGDPLRLRVAVGPGEGRLELVYRPYGLVAGAWVSAAGLLALVALARFERRRAPLATPG